MEWSKKFLGKILDFCLLPALPLVFENYIFSSSRKSEKLNTEVDLKVI